MSDSTKTVYVVFVDESGKEVSRKPRSASGKGRLPATCRRDARGYAIKDSDGNYVCDVKSKQTVTKEEASAPTA